MAKRPRKLKKDGIVESLFELRFESSALSEVYMGRLVSAISALDPSMILERLPASDIPAAFRRSDPNLAYQATLQLRRADGARIGRLGDNVISWHATAPYPGWEVFGPEIARLVAGVRNAVDDCRIVRLGLRYLNFLKSADHLVGGIRDITLDVTISGQVVDYPLNVNYLHDFQAHRVTAKIATPEFIQPRQPEVSLFIDIDVHTEEKPTPDFDGVYAWVEQAHDLLKDEFFGLMKPEILKELVEE